MTNYDDIRKAVETRFNTAWAVRTPIRWENVPFVTPSSGIYVSVFLLIGQGRQISMGSPKLERVKAMVALQIFTPKDSGSTLAQQHVDFAKGIFQNWNATQNGTNLQFETPYQQKAPARADYYQVNVYCPFDADTLFD